MKKIFKLTENDLYNLIKKSVKKVLYENLKTHNDEGAVYTYDYIPPQCIKVYDTFEIKYS